MLSGEKVDNIPTSSQDVKFSIHHGFLYFKDCLIWLYLSVGNKFPTIPGESHIAMKEVVQIAAEKKRTREGVQGRKEKLSQQWQSHEVLLL